MTGDDERECELKLISTSYEWPIDGLGEWRTEEEVSRASEGGRLLAVPGAGGGAEEEGEEEGAAEGEVEEEDARGRDGRPAGSKVVDEPASTEDKE